MNTRLFCREAEDSFAALLTGQAMEACGGTVISVAFDGMHQRQGAMVPCARFVMFCRISAEINLDDVDEKIGAALFPATPAAARKD